MDGLLGRRINAVTAVATAAFLVHQVLLHFGRSIGWADSFLDPLCTVPVLLGIPAFGVQRWLPDWRLPWAHTLAFTALIAAVFEGAVPKFDARFTADILDVVAYALGGVLWRVSEPKLR